VSTLNTALVSTLNTALVSALNTALVERAQYCRTTPTTTPSTLTLLE
jgi:hypothetical protein